ncbi:MAG: Na+/H+ antiporter subunit E [Canibacter sp.]
MIQNGQVPRPQRQTTPLRHKAQYVLRLHELPLLIGLILMWMMLWHEVSLMSFVSGVVVAIFVTRVFYLPPVDLAGRLHIWWALRYLVYFFTQVIIASFHVAWSAIRPDREPAPAIIAVPLRTRSDFIITMTGMTISLIPGSLVVDVDRFGSTLYLHVLDTPTVEAREKFRNDVFWIETLLIRSIGSHAEIEAVK